MGRSLHFSKYSGCGNDFIIIDNRDLFFPTEDSLLIQKLCTRQLGIGADGLILLEPSRFSDFKMRIFNSDGKEAEMCGNGLRCLVHFAKKLGFSKTTFKVETKVYISNTFLDFNYVTASMPPPKIETPVELEDIIPDKIVKLYRIDTGVPHVVFFCDEIENLDIRSLGAMIRHHPIFSPRGTNVNFAKRVCHNRYEIRTYERGVEEETLACGTGATAVAIASYFHGNARSPIEIQTRSREILKITFDKEKEIQNVQMSGTTNYLFDGIFVAN